MLRTLSVIVVVLAAVPMFAQSGIVEGSVVDAVTRTPITGATVKLHSGDKVAYTGASNAQGQFRIEGIANGQYRADIDRTGYLRLAADHIAARPFGISPAKTEIRLVAELVPLANISGRVLSPLGEPMKGVPVGMRRLWHHNWTQTTITDDTGIFRLRNLEPGAWILAGLPSFRISVADPKKNPKPVPPPSGEDGQKVGWAATFFPGVVDLAGAEKIILRPGVALEGYDIKLRTAPHYRLSGVVADQSGKPQPKAGVSLTDVANRGANGALATTDEQGRFEFGTLMDGDWRIVAQGMTAGQKSKGYRDVRISRRDVLGIEVQVTAPFALKGFVDRDESRDADGNRKVTAVYLMPDEVLPDFQESTFHEQDGSFVLKSVYPGRYRALPAGFVPGYYVAAIWYGDRDVTAQAFDIASPPLPLRIVYRSGAARATGKVERGDGAWVVLVPQDEALRDAHQHIRSAKCDADGRFSIDSLRPGAYYAFAFDRLEREMLEDPEFVRRLIPQAARVDVRHGETATLEIRAQTWPDY